MRTTAVLQICEVSFALFREPGEKWFPHPVPKLNDHSHYHWQCVWNAYHWRTLANYWNQVNQSHLLVPRTHKRHAIAFSVRGAWTSSHLSEIQFTQEQRDVLESAKEVANFSCSGERVEQGDESYQHLLYRKFYANQNKTVAMTQWNRCFTLAI